MNLKLAPKGEGAEEGLEMGKPLQGMLSVQREARG